MQKLKIINNILSNAIVSYTWIPEEIKVKLSENNPFIVAGDTVYTNRMWLPRVFNDYSKDCIVIAGGVDCGIYDLDNETVGSPVHFPLSKRWTIKELPSNVKAIFSTNINSVNPKLIPLPYGVQAHQLKQIINLVNSGYLDFIKRNFLYVNFAPEANRVRVPVARFWNDQKLEWAKINFNVNNNPIPYEIACHLNYQWINQSKFVLCPDGNGLDSYRIWESLYLGAIPVVKNLKTYSHPEYLRMPLYKTNDMTEMKVNFEDLMKYNPETVDMSFLTRSYWNNKIKAALNIGNFKS